MPKDRINSLNVSGTSSGKGGDFSLSTGDKSNEKSLRGGSGTDMNETGPVVGGDLKPEAVKTK